MSNRHDPMSVSYATASPDAVADLVATRYALPSHPTCTLLTRGFNDCYAVLTREGGRFVLRLSGHRARGPADVEAETAFMAYLASAGVPVARGGADADRRVVHDGRFCRMARAPPSSSMMPGGRRPDLDDEDDARLQGRDAGQDP